MAPESRQEKVRHRLLRSRTAKQTESPALTGLTNTKSACRRTWIDFTHRVAVEHAFLSEYPQASDSRRRLDLQQPFLVENADNDDRERRRMRSENFLPNLAIRQRIIPGGQEHRSNMGLLVNDSRSGVAGACRLEPLEAVGCRGAPAVFWPSTRRK